MVDEPSFNLAKCERIIKTVFDIVYHNDLSWAELDFTLNQIEHRALADKMAYIMKAVQKPVMMMVPFNNPDVEPETTTATSKPQYIR